jgi:hypothetical protein
MRTYLKENPSQKRAGGMAQGVGPEFKPQYWKKKKKDVLAKWVQINKYLNVYLKRTASRKYKK